MVVAVGLASVGVAQKTWTGSWWRCGGCGTEKWGLGWPGSCRARRRCFFAIRAVRIRSHMAQKITPAEALPMLPAARQLIAPKARRLHVP